VRELSAHGDRDRAATAAIKWYGPAVHRYLLSLLRDWDEAADAHSEWSERLWRALPTFRWDCSLRTWAFTIAWHVAQNVRDEAWRRRRRRLPTTAASALAQEIQSRSPRTVERRWQGLDRLRSRLRVEDHSLLVLRVDQELSWNEIAGILGATPEALMQRFKRLKDRMGRMARDEGLIE
jgi:RNA polymerase sigma-70 factor (ECF subfamily)